MEFTITIFSLQYNKPLLVEKISDLIDAVVQFTLVSFNDDVRVFRFFEGSGDAGHVPDLAQIGTAVEPMGARSWQTFRAHFT